MAYIDHRSGTGTFIPSPYDASRMLRKWLRRRNKRKEVAAMLKCEDWVLKDMGISRGDVREALSHKGDPSLHLRALASRRRFWSRNRDTL